MDVCARELLHVVRSPQPWSRKSLATMGGMKESAEERDGAYHQGTVWGWLLGPFALAHLRVYQDAATAMSFLEPMFRQLAGRGTRHAGEIFDGDAPFAPKGCIAQAWTVGETLRAWRIIANARHEKDAANRAVAG